MRDAQAARAIYQASLDAIGAAVTAADFDTYLSHFSLPHAVESFDRRRMLHTPDDLRAVFLGIQRHLASAGLTELIRHCTAATFRDENTIHGSHETRLVTPQNTIRDSYIVLSTLVRKEGRWQVTASQYAAADVSLPADVMERRDTDTS